jgi:hypothetical protein
MFGRTVRRAAVAAALAAGALVLGGFPRATPAADKHGPHNTQGGGIIIELDNAFIKKYENRATIESEFTIVGLSKVHPPASDGEVHIGGWADEAGLAAVSEVMNAATTGTEARKVFSKAKDDGKKVTVTGAWRIWCEHGGTTQQLQAKGPKPSGNLPGAPSNPDHVFEIHPVTSVKVGNQTTDAAKAIGPTAGFTPHDATKSFGAYEHLSCQILERPGDRTRIITEATGFNFTQFVFRFDEEVHKLDDGHAAIGSVYDTEGELIVRSRRVVFVAGTAADDVAKGAKKGDRLLLIGIPRVSLKLVRFRLANKDDLKQSHGTDPLGWRLPYEMIAVAAVPVEGDDDD